MSFQSQECLHRLSADRTFLSFLLHDLCAGVAKAHVVARLNDGVDGALVEANETSLVVVGLGFQNALADAVDIHKVAPLSVDHNVWVKTSYSY